MSCCFDMLTAVAVLGIITEPVWTCAGCVVGVVVASVGYAMVDCARDVNKEDDVNTVGAVEETVLDILSRGVDTTLVTAGNVVFEFVIVVLISVLGIELYLALGWKGGATVECVRSGE